MRGLGRASFDPMPFFWLQGMVSYRVVIMALDFLTLYLFTRTFKVALGFMIASNLYTTVGYVIHERLWDRVKWGLHETP